MRVRRVTLSLVTGGSGFVGRHLRAALEARGETVRVLDLSAAAAKGDICGSVADEDAARRAVEGVDFVFHLAGNAQLWARDPRAFHEANVVGAQVMLRASEAAKVRRFVHCSSLTTLVGARTPIGPSMTDETIRLAPEDMLGAYPRSKLLAERAVESAAGRGLDAVVGLPTEPLGAGDDSLTPPTKMIRDFLNGKTPAYIDCMLNFVPVRDLAEGLIALRDRGRRGERYLLGGENIDMRRLLDTLAAQSGRAMPTTRLPYAVALLAGIVDTMIAAPATGRAPTAPLTGVRLAGRRVSFSSEKAARDLGWRARTPFETALSETLAWFDRRASA